MKINKAGFRLLSILSLALVFLRMPQQNILYSYAMVHIHILYFIVQTKNAYLGVSGASSGVFVSLIDLFHEVLAQLHAAIILTQPGQSKVNTKCTFLCVSQSDLFYINLQRIKRKKR